MQLKQQSTLHPRSGKRITGAEYEFYTSNFSYTQFILVEVRTERRIPTKKIRLRSMLANGRIELYVRDGKST